MSYRETKENIDALGYAFHTFKQENDKRLNNLESKQSIDPLLAEKLEKIESAMDKLEKDLDNRRQSQKKLRHNIFSTQDGLDHNAMYHKSFLQYVRYGRETNLRDLEKKFDTEKPENGGYFIPESMIQSVEKKLNDAGFLRNYAKVLQTSGRKLDILQEETEFPVKWLDVRNLEFENNTKISQIPISLYTIYSQSSLEHSLLEDSHFPIEQWIFDRVIRQIALQENFTFFKGTGKDQPTGILHHINQEGLQGIEQIKTGADKDFKEGEDGAATLYQTVDALKECYISGALWMMSKTAQSKVRRLKDQEKNYLWQPPLMRENQSAILGYPVVVSENLPSLTEENPTSILFGNFQEGYVIVDSSSPMYMVRDDKTKKPFVELYISKRVGGNVLHGEALKAITFAV